MRLAELLTPDPICVAPDTDFATAIELMDRHDFRHLPVVERGELVGMISDRDLLAATGWKPSRLARRRGAAPGQVRTVMRTDPIVASVGDPPTQVARLMLEGRVHGLPVVEGTRLVGIVTDYDFLVAFVRAAQDGRLAEVDDPEVSACMTKDVVTIDRRTTIAEAFSSLHRCDVLHLLVVEGGRPVGIVSDRDVRLAIGRGVSTHLPVPAIGSRELVTVGPGARLSGAADLMALHKIGAVPVVDEERLLGVLSSSDVLAICATLSAEGA